MPPTDSFEMDSLAGKVNPVSADTLLLKDSAALNELKELAFSDLESSILANVVFNNQANTYTGAGLQDFGGSALDNVSILTTNTINPASTGVIRLSNVDTIAWRNQLNNGDNVISIQGTANQFVFSPPALTPSASVTLASIAPAVVDQLIADLRFEGLDDGSNSTTYTQFDVRPQAIGNGLEVAELRIRIRQSGNLLNSFMVFNDAGDDTIHVFRDFDMEDNNILLGTGEITVTSGVMGDLLKHDATGFVRFPFGTSLQVLRVNAGGTDLEYADAAGGAATQFTWGASDEDSPLITGLQYTTEAAVAEVALSEVILSLKNAPTGSTITVDILKEDGVNLNTFTTIFSVLPTIDINEFTSQTAATAAVISDATWEIERRLQLVLTINDSNAAATGIKVTLA